MHMREYQACDWLRKRFRFADVTSEIERLFLKIYFSPYVLKQNLVKKYP